MKKNVLVFPCGSEIGLEIYKSLYGSTHFNVIGGSTVGDHGQFIYENYIDSIPYVDDPGFIEKINNTIVEHKISFIFPAHDDVVLKLAQEKANGNLKCEVITSPLGTCKIIRSKLKTYELLSGLISTPKVFKNITELVQSDFPIFMKPDVGQGSKGIYIAENYEEVIFYSKKDPSLLLLEYLPGKEYTIDCFTNKNGSLMFSKGRERRRISNGISVNSIAVRDDRFAKLADVINGALDLKGVWFFQVKENKSGDLVLMEVASRVAGTMGLIRCKGVNLPLLSLFEAQGHEIDIIENKDELIIDRALENKYKHSFTYGHVYLDLDDLVILDGKVNSRIIAFIYQCINRGVRLHLITRHNKDLKETLNQYRLNDIFDDLILVGEDDEKYKHISKQDAIFIDDSYAERKKVSEKCKIPVFDAHMIDSLLESYN